MKAPTVINDHNAMIAASIYDIDPIYIFVKLYAKRLNGLIKT